MHIRRAIQNDSEFLFNLRNELAVRENSWNSDLVERSGHEKWLSASFQNPARALYIAEDEQGVSVGHVRYDMEGENSAEVGISVRSDQAGKGYGTKMLVESANVFFSEFPQVKKIIAHIKHGNPGSVRVFSKAGYSDPVKVVYEGHDCLEMTLARQ